MFGLIGIETQPRKYCEIESGGVDIRKIGGMVVSYKLGGLWGNAESMCPMNVAISQTIAFCVFLCVLFIFFFNVK